MAAVAPVPRALSGCSSLWGACLPRSLCAVAAGVAIGIAPAAAVEAVVGSWAPAGELSTGRYAPAAVRLEDGRVLVAGGYSFEEGATHRTSELLDPETLRWTPGPELGTDRNFLLVAPVTAGETLFITGFRLRGGTTPAAEILDRLGMRFRASGPCLEERELAAWAPLPGGRILIAGGYSTRRRVTLASSEVYDPSTGKAAAAAPMQHPRFGHSAVALPDGKVLIVGGKVLGSEERVLEAELYDPAKDAYTAAGSLACGRDRCSAWLLPDQRRVLVCGGSAREGGSVPARRSEIWDPALGRFSPGPELVRDRMAHVASYLDRGRVLLSGGWSDSEGRTTGQAELWDPAAERFLPAGVMKAGRHDHAAVVLSDGRVVVAGGKEAPARGGVESPKECEIWKAAGPS